MSDRDTYFEKFKSPKWQKCRLQIMKRAGFKCENCGDDAEELSVHHGYYQWERDPWDYPKDTLRCLCKTCHQDMSDLLRDMRVSIARVHPSNLNVLFDLVSALNVGDGDERDAKADDLSSLFWLWSEGKHLYDYQLLCIETASGKEKNQEAGEK